MKALLYREKIITTAYHFYFGGSYFWREIKNEIIRGANVRESLFKRFILSIIFIICKRKFVNLYSLECRETVIVLKSDLHLPT